MIQIFLFLLLISLCIFLKKEVTLYVFAFVLPFHSFIKSAMDYLKMGGEVFALWKEVAILIFFYRVMQDKKFKLNRTLILISLFFFLIIIAYYFLATDPKSGLAALRNHIFPVLLLIAITACPLPANFAENFLKFTFIAAFFSFIGCVLQSFVFSLQIGAIKGVIDFVDDAGYVQYTTNSARIMGMERMSGLFGGPNDLGLYCAFVIVLTFGVLSFKPKINLTKWKLYFIYITLAMAAFCILLSFSRAGWVISFIGCFILMRTNKVKVGMHTIIIGSFVLVTGLVVVLQKVPDKFLKIFENSVTLKEASAANRSESFYNGMEKDFSEPYGHGLGTTDNRNKGYEFAVESAFWNIAYEIGIFGLITLIMFYVSIARFTLRDKLNYKANFFSHVSVALISVSVIASFFSLNTYGMPYIYYWWLLMGLGMNASSIFHKLQAYEIISSLSNKRVQPT